MSSKSNPALKWFASLLVAAALWVSADTARVAPIGFAHLQAPTYSVEQIAAGGATEYKFKLDNRHFATLIDEGGTYAFRPHPGCDINGWGTTWYAQPFLPLPEPVLTNTILGPIGADPAGIHVRASGKVSRGPTLTYGDWSSLIDYTFDPAGQVIAGAGQYTITLAGPLGEATGDLNLYKIASNYLDDVPLLSGGIGDTGDMKEAIVMKEAGVAWFTWVPPDQPAHFPTDKTDDLSIDVIGWLNEVDTAKQGYAAILPAFKPGLKVVLISLKPGAGMMFGAIYNLAERQQFWSDNVGITPLISKTSPDTEFLFDVQLESVAIETCRYLPLIRKP